MKKINIEKQKRLEKALRENLLKRKDQKRSRQDVPEALIEIENVENNESEKKDKK